MRVSQEQRGGNTSAELRVGRMMTGLWPKQVSHTNTHEGRLME